MARYLHHINKPLIPLFSDPSDFLHNEKENSMKRFDSVALYSDVSAGIFSRAELPVMFMLCAAYHGHSGFTSILARNMLKQPEFDELSNNYKGNYNVKEIFFGISAGYGHFGGTARCCRTSGSRNSRLHLSGISVEQQE